MTESRKDFKAANAAMVLEPNVFVWILNDLVDACRKYGAAHHSLQQRRLELKLDDGRSAWVHVKMEGNDFFFVSHEQGRLNINVDGQMLMDPERGITIGWSNYVGIAEVMEAVWYLDAEMAELGRFNPTTGVRTAPAEELVGHVEVEKVRIDEMFDPPWLQAAVTLSADMTDEEIKNLFDRPEEIIVGNHHGLMVDLSTVRGKAMRDEAADAVLARLGYAREILPILSREVIASIIEEVELYLQGMPR